MKKQPFILKSGVHKICITNSIEYPTQKPVIRIECIDDDTCTQDLDGEWIEEYECATYTFYKPEELDLFIKELQEARGFLNK